MTEPEPGVPAQPEQFPAEGPNSLASFPQRIIGRVVDLIVLSAPVALVLVPRFERDGDSVVLDAPEWLYIFIVLVVPVLYETAMIAIWGRTVGKATARTRVARLADGEGPRPYQAGLRAVVPVAALSIPLIGFVLWLAVYLVAVANPLRQGWHDRAAGTVVVRTR